LSEVGKIAWDEWNKSPEIRADMNLTLGEFVVMPDHVHGILIIGKNQFNEKRSRCRNGNSALNSFSPQRKNLASFIRGYKSAVTTWARKHQIEFGWQAGYHDRVIRTEREFRRICHYIIKNPERWHKPPPG
jgi:REP element-mobilizing transposase RayT